MRHGASLGFALAVGVFSLFACTRSPMPRSMASAAAGSPLAKVQPGMSFEQVVHVLGLPTSQTTYPTSQVFNPLAVGNEAYVTAFRYGKLGRVWFAGPDYRGQGTSVIGVEEDASETGLSGE